LRKLTQALRKLSQASGNDFPGPGDVSGTYSALALGKSEPSQAENKLALGLRTLYQDKSELPRDVVTPPIRVANSPLTCRNGRVEELLKF
jgi:hypothetical protein